MRKSDRFLWAFCYFMLPHLRNFGQLLPFAEQKSVATVVFASICFQMTDFWGRDPTQMDFSHPNGSFEKIPIISLNKSAPRSKSHPLHPNGLYYFALPNSLLYPPAMSSAPYGMQYFALPNTLL